MKKGSPQRTKLPIGQVIREALALVDSELKTRRVSVRTTLGNELPDVLGDRVQLQQVLLNLITNGIEALSSVTDGPRILEIRAEAEPSGGVIVSVRDSGAGVDPAIIDRIFDPFFTTKAEGIGIGLSISRSIIESHGGRLSMVANQGRGMTFQFTLPSGAGGAVTS